MVKSKLPPRSGSSLEAVESHPEKGAIKFVFFQCSAAVGEKPFQYSCYFFYTLVLGASKILLVR